MTVGLREIVVALILLVAGYMLIVLVRMLGLRWPTRAAAPAVAPPRSPAPAAAPATTPDDSQLPGVSAWEMAASELAERALHDGMEQEVTQLREEVDALRGELAALRADLQQELAHLRATQTVSPLYGDAMQMATAGYNAAAIAERCGIARAEADLVVALAQSQER